MSDLPQPGSNEAVTTSNNASAAGLSADEAKAPRPTSSGSLKGTYDNDQRMSQDGQPFKRRISIPSSKPVLTRRQKLNRQAEEKLIPFIGPFIKRHPNLLHTLDPLFTLNKTHRGRKERYVNKLEEHAKQLRGFSRGSVEERDAVVDDNRKLKELLRAQGILCEETGQSSSAAAGDAPETSAEQPQAVPGSSKTSTPGALGSSDVAP